ncbi:hypothetical protein S83_002381 [Arachis hypogaea]
MSLVLCSSPSAVARSLILSLRRARFLILSIHGIARSPLHHSCSLILDMQHATAAAANSGPPLHCFLSPLYSSFSPVTLISVLLPPPLPLRPTLVSYVAPEYACTGMLTEKSDINNFGILIIRGVHGSVFS